MEAADRADAELGSKIAAARFARGLTQTQLARRAGVDRTYITAIEGGDLPGSEDVRQQILNILEARPRRATASGDRAPMPVVWPADRVEARQRLLLLHQPPEARSPCRAPYERPRQCD